MIHEASDEEVVYDYAVQRGVKDGTSMEELDEIISDIELEGSYSAVDLDGVRDRLLDNFKINEGTRQKAAAERWLKRVLRETVQGHIDGHPFPGSLEDLAKHHGQCWGHGSVVDPADWKENIKQGGLYTVGKASSPLKRKRVKLSEKQLRVIVREVLQEG